MLPSTLSVSSSTQNIFANLPRRLLLHTQLYDLQLTTPAPTPSHQESHSSWSNIGLDANIILVLSVLICAVLCTLCINSFLRCMLKCSSLLTGEHNYYINPIRQVVGKGVDKRALKTFPVVKYSKDMKVCQALDTDCVICLSEFKEGEKVRLLPKCNHGFHVKCIDKWLSSHTSCPTCRQSLVETCQKIIDCGNQQHISCSSVPVIGEMVAVRIMPLEREDLSRNYRR